MIEYRPAVALDLLHLEVQASQSRELEYVRQTPGMADEIVERSLCLSGHVGGFPVAVAGFVPSGAVSHRAWAFFAPEAGPYMLGIVRKARAMMSSLRSRRIDMTVNEGFIEGERFARLLGMERETSTALKYHGVLGEHQHIYGKVR